MMVLVQGRQRIRHRQADIPCVVIHICHGTRHRTSQSIRRVKRNTGQCFGLCQAYFVAGYLGLFPEQTHRRVVLVGFPHIVVVRLQGNGTVQQRRIGQQQPVLVDAQQDVQLLRNQYQAVLGFGQRKAVVGKLHLAAQHIVVRYQSLFLHLADIFQPAFRLFDVPRQYLTLFVQAEQVHISLQQPQLHIGTVVGGLKRCRMRLQVGFPDSISYLSPFVKRLGEVYRIILRPVGSIGIRGIRQAALKHNGLPHDSSAQAYLQIGQTRSTRRLSPLVSHRLVQQVRLQLQAVGFAQAEQFIHGQQQRTGSLRVSLSFSHRSRLAPGTGKPPEHQPAKSLPTHRRSVLSRTLSLSSSLPRAPCLPMHKCRPAWH